MSPRITRLAVAPDQYSQPYNYSRLHVPVGSPALQHELHLDLRGYPYEPEVALVGGSAGGSEQDTVDTAGFCDKIRAAVASEAFDAVVLYDLWGMGRRCARQFILGILTHFVLLSCTCDPRACFDAPELGSVWRISAVVVRARRPQAIGVITMMLVMGP
ncbi:hypothetical protein NMY22_g5025 [Coprinellus aureogranulatus]|nr:hypothetical protein NMY22_g5025 [Coprinellus aureogranulatus]